MTYFGLLPDVDSYRHILYRAERPRSASRISQRSHQIGELNFDQEKICVAHPSTIQSHLHISSPNLNPKRVSLGVSTSSRWRLL
ncbi:hypothetical protein K440DRAFT_29854 [Wilcoxina mikolae CBS 423.85]|nr:hypothetical protein K440DRAFT_29854 [Wilcoxina mikolae CBS 423.85]